MGVFSSIERANEGELKDCSDQESSHCETHDHPRIHSPPTEEFMLGRRFKSRVSLRKSAETVCRIRDGVQRGLKKSGWGRLWIHPVQTLGSAEVGGGGQVVALNSASPLM